MSGEVNNTRIGGRTLGTIFETADAACVQAWLSVSSSRRMNTKRKLPCFISLSRKEIFFFFFFKGASLLKSKFCSRLSALLQQAKKAKNKFSGPVSFVSK